MSRSKASNSYKTNALETASPGKLILMLYDGVLKFLDGAEKGFEDENPSRSIEKINNNLQRALNIVFELRGCLDMSVEGEFPKTMYALYSYMVERIVQANIKKEKAPIIEVMGYMKEIRDSWAEMLKTVEEPEGEETTVSVSCSA